MCRLLLTGARTERMGRREAESRGAMNRSGLGCLQDAVSSANDGQRQRNPNIDATAREPSATKPTKVKKHQHKHNLKHRYEVMETLGKGTYGKVKKAVERASLRTVSICHALTQSFQFVVSPLLTQVSKIPFKPDVNI